MGLLSRFRNVSSSSTNANSSSNSNSNAIASSSTPAHEHAPRTPKTPPSTNSELLPELISPSKKLLRPTIPPSSPSNSSITSKIIPWKKDKGKGKAKEKEKEKDQIGGIPYESTSLTVPSSPLQIPNTKRTVSTPNSPHSTGRIQNKQRRSTLLTFDPPNTSSPLSDSHQSLQQTYDSHDRNGTRKSDVEEHILDQDEIPQNGYYGNLNQNRKDRVSSGQFRQIGGILGQLNFEVDSSSPPEKWLKRNSNPPNSNSIIPSQSNFANEINNQGIDKDDDRGLTPSITNESIIIINKDEIPFSTSTSSSQQQSYQDLQPDTSQISTTQGSSTDHDDDIDNKVELLESAEKKNKFWKRPRRSSKSHVEAVEVDRSTSPTPRRNSRNDTSLDLTTDRPSIDLNLPEPRTSRPQQLRRPSSSFFHNPFTRSVSRTSLAMDYEASKPDEGSFQLRGFRHVSGMMEVEGAGELENYVGHFRNQPRSSMSSADLLTSPVITTSDEIQPVPSPTIHSPPPTSYTPRQLPPTFPLSRPTSIANSLASATGDDLITMNKVSVAAFRKGIRRPSENFTATLSDSGHYTSRNPSGQHPILHNGNSDDEDDIPLGMIKGKDMKGEKSSQSLSSLRNIGNDSLSVGNLTPATNGRRPATMFDNIERKSSPLQDPNTVKLSRQLSSEIIDRKNTPSPGNTERKFTPSPQTNLSSFVPTPDISRRGSPSLGTSQDIVRKPSPNPALSFTVHRQKQSGHQRNGHGSGGSGFVVKSTRLTRDDLLPKHMIEQNVEHSSASHTPVTSGPSTPNPLQDEPTFKQKARPNMVGSPEEMSPIDGYFSHLAPFITDQPQEDTVIPPTTSRHSPNHAPGPPIVPLPLPLHGDKIPASLNLPLPPDQMPDTPPKNPTDLPNPDQSRSPGGRKKLSLLDEPIRVLSGLWNSPSQGDDGFDPALVLSSMDALGGDDQEEKARPSERQPLRVVSSNIQNNTPGTATTNVEENVRSPLSERLAGIAFSANPNSNNLSRPPLAQIHTFHNDLHDDDHSSERIKSPISNSTLSPVLKNNIPVPPPASNTITTNTSFPSSSSSTTTTTRPAPRETFTSSFSRARKPSRKNQDSEESDEESESERGTGESRNTTPQAKIQPRIKVNINTGSNKDKNKVVTPNTSERKIPHGPRKPSVKDRKRVSSMFSTSTTQIQTQNKMLNDENEDDEKPLGILRNKASKSSLSPVDTRRPIVKSTSVSNLGPSSRSHSSLGFSSTQRRDVSTPGNGQRPKTLLELGPIVQPLKDGSTNHATSPISIKTNFNSRDPISSNRPQVQRPPSSASASASSRPTSNERKKSTTPIMKRSPGQTLIKLPSDINESVIGIGNRKTASPDSSRSATTGGSVNYQPMTPKDSNDSRKLQKDQSPSIGKDVVNKQITYDDNSKHQESQPRIDHQRQRSYSSIDPNHPHNQLPNYNNQNQNQWNMNMNMPSGMGMGFDQNQMNMGMMPQMGMGMGMGGMSQEAIHNMMKQQWQMQFMAAAYRASEEEWERASCVSGQTNHTVPASFGQQSFQPMPNMGWNPMMGQYPNSMGMNGYGYPQQGMFPNQSYGYNMPPSSPGAGSTLNLPGGGSMYSYGNNGVGAQSVFGGEFGPPPITPSQRFGHGHQSQSQIPPLPSLPSSTSNSNLLNSNQRGRRGSTSQSVYIPSNLSSGINVSSQQQNTPSSPVPPSSWSRRNGSGDWSDLNQNQNQNQNQSQSQNQVRKARPQTQFIN